MSHFPNVPVIEFEGSKSKNPFAFKLQYCEIVDLETMAPVASTVGFSCAIAIACHLGATRLIDNADL